ncbi:MAG: thioredoxin family protein [Firmicutes bacterium]|nr:thioredoxin family protein [Bacillota bacterium]
MEIKVVGSGCASCKRLLELVKDAVGQLGVQADVFYVTDIEEIMATGIIQLPGLVVDGKIKTTGRVPSLRELKQMIQDEM